MATLNTEKISGDGRFPIFNVPVPNTAKFYVKKEKLAGSSASDEIKEITIDEEIKKHRIRLDSRGNSAYLVQNKESKTMDKYIDG